jgi:predicted PurR-regulated permease PerM
MALKIYQIILISLIILLFLTLCASWLYLLKVLKPQITRHLPTSQDTINVYINYPNKLDEIYHDNANKMKQVIDEYKSTNKVKVQFLSKAYNYISISGILFVIILPLSVLYKYLT